MMHKLFAAVPLAAAFLLTGCPGGPSPIDTDIDSDTNCPRSTNGCDQPTATLSVHPTINGEPEECQMVVESQNYEDVVLNTGDVETVPALVQLHVDINRAKHTSAEDGERGIHEDAQHMRWVLEDTTVNLSEGEDKLLNVGFNPYWKGFLICTYNGANGTSYGSYEVRDGYRLDINPFGNEGSWLEFDGRIVSTAGNSQLTIVQSTVVYTRDTLSYTLTNGEATADVACTFLEE